MKAWKRAPRAATPFADRRLCPDRYRRSPSMPPVDPTTARASVLGDSDRRGHASLPPFGIVRTLLPGPSRERRRLTAEALAVPQRRPLMGVTRNLQSRCRGPSATPRAATGPLYSSLSRWGASGDQPSCNNKTRTELRLLPGRSLRAISTPWPGAISRPPDGS